MRRIFAVTCFLACSTLASGQAYTTITAANVTVDNGSGAAVNPPAGSSLCFLGVNSLGAAITYTPSGGSPVSGTVCQTLTSGGALTGTLQVANPATATPLGLHYTITVINGSTTYLTIPTTTVSGTTWSFDSFSLAGTKTALGIGKPHLTCAGGAQWTSTTLPPGQNGATCNSSGVWSYYPPSSFCPSNNAFLVPQSGGSPFCLTSELSGNGAPSGLCTQNSRYLQLDATLGANLWNCINGAWVQQGSGSGSGTVQASPQFQIPYYDVAGTNAHVKGDSGITTDGNGNLTAKGFNFSNLVHASDFGVVGDEIDNHDGSMAVGSTTLTATTSPFTSGMVGHPITVIGAGAAGAYLITTISGFTDANHVSLSLAAGTTVANAEYFTGTDNTSAFAALTAYLVAHDGTTVIFAPGGYEYTYNFLFTNVKNALILGNGAKWRCLTSSGANPFALVTNTGPLNYSSSTYYPINTVGLGSTSVTATAAANAGNFKPGDLVFVGGYIQQNGGAPPNLRYFEYHRVVSANASTGVIGLDTTLQHGYDSGWYPVSYTAGGGAAVNIGSPVIIDLDQGVAGTFGEKLTLQDVTFLGSNVSGSNVNGLGDVQIVGENNFLCLRCTGHYLDVSGDNIVTVRDSKFLSAEPDKEVSSLVLDGGSYGPIAEATGVDNLVIENASVSGEVYVAPRHFTFRSNKFTADSTSQSYGTYVSASSAGGAAAWPTVSFDAEGNTFWRYAGDTAGALRAGGSNTVTALTATATTFTAAFTNNVASPIDIGTVLFNATKTGTVTAIDWNGTNFTITVSGFTPTASDIYTFNTVHSANFPAGNAFANSGQNGLISASAVDNINSPFLQEQATGPTQIISGQSPGLTQDNVGQYQGVASLNLSGLSGGSNYVCGAYVPGITVADICLGDSTSQVGIFQFLQNGLIGTRDMLLEIDPDTTSGYGGIEVGGGVGAAAGAGMLLGTASATPVLIRPNRTLEATFSAAAGAPSLALTNGLQVGGIIAGASSSAVASAATIAPAAQFFHVSGTAAIATITPPTACTTASYMCQLTIIPDGAFTTTTAGNIAIVSTAVVGKALIMTYDPGASKWYPSY